MQVLPDLRHPTSRDEPLSLPGGVGIGLDDGELSKQS